MLWVHRLPYRITQAGPGGGGPLSIDEMREALLLDSDEAVLWESLAGSLPGVGFAGFTVPLRAPRAHRNHSLTSKTPSCARLSTCCICEA